MRPLALAVIGRRLMPSRVPCLDSLGFSSWHHLAVAPPTIFFFSPLPCYKRRRPAPSARHTPNTFIANAPRIRTSLFVIHPLFDWPTC